jgi:hypothetical protein
MDVPAANNRKFGLVSMVGWIALNVADRVTSMAPVSRSIVGFKKPFPNLPVFSGGEREFRSIIPLVLDRGNQRANRKYGRGIR